MRLRNQHPEWFNADAAYVPVEATGAAADHVVSFMRGEHVIAVGQRFPHTLAGQWERTEIVLPAGTWEDRLSGERHSGGCIQLSDLLRQFPVALLVRDQD